MEGYIIIAVLSLLLVVQAVLLVESIRFFKRCTGTMNQMERYVKDVLADVTEEEPQESRITRKEPTGTMTDTEQEALLQEMLGGLFS